MDVVQRSLLREHFKNRLINSIRIIYILVIVQNRFQILPMLVFKPNTYGSSVRFQVDLRTIRNSSVRHGKFLVLLDLSSRIPCTSLRILDTMPDTVLHVL